MSMTRDGASLDAHFAEPAIDLATLIEGLAEAVSPPDIATRYPAERWPIISWDTRERALGLNTRGVLARFWHTRPVRQLGSRFLRDAPIPKSRARAHLGGQIVPGTEGRLRIATNRLVRVLDAEIDAAVTRGVDLSLLAGSPAVETLQILGKRLGCRLENVVSASTHIERVAFAPVGTTQRARQSEVARVMAAFEQLGGDRDRHIADFAAAVRSMLQRRDFSERDIDAALHHHTSQAHQTGSQLARFFDFLEDDALARIRVEVGCRMMETLADEALARSARDASDGLTLLNTYVRRALGLWGLLRAFDGPDLSLHLSSVYGEVGEVTFSIEAVPAGFAGCLPVWPAWATQLFEDDRSGVDSSVIRELSYRFRVNGREPTSGESAFAARIDRFEQDLLHADEPQRVRRSLAELVFLGAVVPRLEHENVEPDAVFATAQELIRRLEQDGRQGIAALIADLRGRENVMDRIASSLIGLLKSEGTAITRSVEGRVWDFHINVARSLVDWQRIASAVDRPLAAGPSPSQEIIDFFGAIQISADRSVPGSLFSVPVRVRLSERSLRVVGEPADVSLMRQIPERLLSVVWRPFQRLSVENGREWVPAGSAADEWLVPNRVEIQYDPRSVGDPRDRQEETLSKVAVSRTALAVLVYVALLRLIRRASENGRQQPTISMLRLQQGGRETRTWSGEAGIFATAQAVEAALGRDLDVRMQGIVLDEQTRTSRYKRRGIYGALLAGFPIRIEQENGDHPPIGIVSFAARPCNDHPDLSHSRGRRLFLTRTYLASPIAEPSRGYDVRVLRTRTEVGDADIRLPETVHDEIRCLYEAHGCWHVILLSHRFAERRIGRHASAARLRDQAQILRDASEAFPDLALYPLVRDIFPTTRIRSPRRDEDAFEILHPDEHVHAAPEIARPLRQAYTPVYSLATLHVVGETAASAKPQSGFCTYFLLGDDGSAPVATAERVRANLLLPESAIRPSLLAALRSIHYLEAERAVAGSQAGKPVLDPYDWMAPGTAGKVGEVVVFEQSRRRPGSIVLSLTALLDAVSGILHASPDHDNRATGEQRGRDINAE